jgi:3D (Asp-Asp-Asp) domain-containing protein
LSDERKAVGRLLPRVVPKGGGIRYVLYFLLAGLALVVGRGRTPAFNVYPVTISAYTSLPHLTDSTPWLTASLTRTRVEYYLNKPYHVVALSRDLAKRIPFGTRVAIFCNGKTYYGIAEDLMHKRWQMRVDIWFPSLQAARNFGICRGELWVPK